MTDVQRAYRLYGQQLSEEHPWQFRRFRKYLNGTRYQY